MDASVLVALLNRHDLWNAEAEALQRTLFDQLSWLKRVAAPADL